MASDEDVDDIDEELARIEQQIQELEQEAGELEPEAAEPEPDDVDAPAPEEAFEGEPDVDEEPGRLSALLDRFDTDDEASDGDAHDDGGVLGFLGDDEDEEEQADPTETAEEETASEPAAEPALDDPSPEPAEDDELADDGADGGGVLGFLGDGDDEGEAEEAAEIDGDGDEDEEAEADTADTPAGEPDGPEAEPAAAEPPSEEEGEEATRASTLLARFQGGESGDPSGGDPAEDDDDDGGGILVPALIALLLLAGLATAAYLLVPGAGSTGELNANLSADAFTDDQGRHVATAGEPLTLDASGSEGDIESYRWAFGDGESQTTSEPTVEHTYDERGTYTADVTVSGSDSEATTRLEVLVVAPPTAEPTFLVDGEPAAEPATVGNNALVGDMVTLDATASTSDPDQSITGYAWDVDGDGEPDANGAEAETAFDQAGRWEVDLTVRDDLGNEDTATSAVHVSDQRAIEDTIGPSSTEADTNSYTVPVEPARLDARPVQFDVQLTYNTSSNESDDLVVQPSVDADLDLNVTDAEGNVFQAEDDEGQGEETLTVEGSDLANLGEWNVTVRQDNQNAGTASEVQYDLVIRTIY